MKRTRIHKHTEHHVGLLKAKRSNIDHLLEIGFSLILVSDDAKAITRLSRMSE